MKLEGDIKDLRGYRGRKLFSMYDAVAEAREKADQAQRLKGELARQRLQVQKAEAQINQLRVEVHELLAEDFYTTQDVVEKLGLEFRDITRFARQGRWPAIKIMDRWFIERERIDYENETQDIF